MKRILQGISLSLALHALTVAADEDTYLIVPGDSLSAISKQKWGNLEKWHDLYELNKNSIKNPNLIYPGQKLKLITAEQATFFEKRNEAVNEAVTVSAAAAEVISPSRSDHSKSQKNHSSEEWRLLPLQSWERYSFTVPKQVDQLGFDKRSKVQKRFVNKTPMTATIASDRLAIQGEIVAARTEYEHVFLGEQVFIKADESIQVGTTYSITAGPEKIRSHRDGRVGFIYDLFGKVKIIGVRDNTFIGTIIELQHPLTRKNLLIPEVKTVEIKEPVAATQNIFASIVSSEATEENMLGENHITFIDAGTSDGVKPGMIFRYFLHEDPYTHKKISSEDYLIEAELQVLDAKDQFSTALIVRGRNVIRANGDVVALTDLTDYLKHMGMQTNIQDSSPVQEPDSLDSLDTNDGVGEREERELHQLEIWTKAQEIQKIKPPDQPDNSIGNEPAPNDSKMKPTGDAPLPPPPPPASAPQSEQTDPPAPLATPPPAEPASSPAMN